MLQDRKGRDECLGAGTLGRLYRGFIGLEKFDGAERAPEWKMTAESSSFHVERITHTSFTAEGPCFDFDSAIFLHWYL